MQPSKFDLDEIKKELSIQHDLQNPFAFHALKIIVRLCEMGKELESKVRELEVQRDYLAFEISSGDDQSDCDHTHLPCEHRKGWLCKAGHKGQMQCWISEAEKFAKEALNPDDAGESSHIE